MLWIKSFHLIALVSWFAGLFYLPRLFVYHSMSIDQISLERFKKMERLLYRAIMMPAMIATVVFGFWLLLEYEASHLHMRWLHVKLFLTGTLIIYHFYCGYLIEKFCANQNTHTHVFYRWFNEYPTFVLISVVILTVVKPF